MLSKELVDMINFQNIGDQGSYKDLLELDGAFSVAHINYGNSPQFNGEDGKNIAKNSRRNSLSSMEHVEDVLASFSAMNGTEKDYKKADRIILWKNYWLEYVNAFDKLIIILPKSVVTAYVGRQAIELGFKYLLIQKNVTERDLRTHNLEELAALLWSKYVINEDYMEGVLDFCDIYSKMIEGENVEYFRYPEYNKSTYFAGNRLDIEWLSYNFSLILLKLLHFAGL